MRDLHRAGELFERACEGGEPEACFRLGELLDAAEPSRALALYQKACGYGHDEACEHAAPRHLAGR
jgi:TPR repeat protein